VKDVKGRREREKGEKRENDLLVIGGKKEGKNLFPERRKGGIAREEGKGVFLKMKKRLRGIPSSHLSLRGGKREKKEGRSSSTLTKEGKRTRKGEI